MSEPMAAILSAALVLLAALIATLAAGRRLPRRPNGFRVSLGIMALVCLDIALVTLVLSKPAILGLPLNVRVNIDGIAASAGTLAMMFGMVLLLVSCADAPMLAALTHMPTWLYRWLYGTSDQQSPRSGE